MSTNKRIVVERMLVKDKQEIRYSEGHDLLLQTIVGAGLALLVGGALFAAATAILNFLGIR
jgi:hypothetical protein